MLSIEDVLEILSTPLLGIIPESEEVLRASNIGSPVTLNNATSAPGRAYLDAARRLKGEDVPMTHPERPQGLVRQAVRTESGMSLLDLFRRRGSAPVARERLQILLAHERATRGQPDLLAILREEILAAIAKHVTVEHDSVQVRMDRGASVSTLEIDVEIPHSAGMLLAAGS